MYCPQANVISPFSAKSKPGSANALMTDTDGDGEHDVILEKDDSGNTYLHLVMPASAVNFLNGSDGSSLFNFSGSRNEQAQPDTTGDEVFIEVGCKVYEVNKVNYRGRNER